MALHQLHRRHAARLTHYARRILRSEAEAEEVVQDVFLLAWGHAGRYDAARGTVVAWLTAMTRSRSIDVLRGQRAQKRHPTVDPTQPTWASNHFEISSANYAMLHASISVLPDAQRELVDLAFFEGLTHAQIVATTGLPLGTVKSRLRMAVANLRLAVPRQSVDALWRGQRSLRQRRWEWLTDRVLGDLADIYFVDLVVQDEKIQRTGWGHVDPALQDHLDQIWRFVPPLAFNQHPVRQAILTGSPELVSHTSTSWQGKVAVSPQHLRFMQQLQIQSLICQPIAHHGSTMGSLTLVRTAASGLRYRAEDLQAARRVAAMIGAALSDR